MNEKVNQGFMYLNQEDQEAIKKLAAGETSAEGYIMRDVPIEIGQGAATDLLGRIQEEVNIVNKNIRVNLLSTSDSEAGYKHVGFATYKLTRNN